MGKTQQHNISLERGAKISACGRYRWTLWRRWDSTLPTLGWVMLNPSTADAYKEDPTIRRCIGFARAWGYGGIEVRNLFALRTPDPGVLMAHDQPIGRLGTKAILELTESCREVVAAWGAAAWPLCRRRGEVVTGELARRGMRVVCLGVTRDGSPRHPLYAPGRLKPVAYGGRRRESTT